LAFLQPDKLELDAGINLKQVLQDIKDAIGGNTIDAVVIPLMAN